jgi:hypothetical protein
MSVLLHVLPSSHLSTDQTLEQLPYTAYVLLHVVNLCCCPQAALGLNKGSSRQLTILDNLHGVLKPVSYGTCMEGQGVQ